MEKRKGLLAARESARDIRTIPCLASHSPARVSHESLAESLSVPGLSFLEGEADKCLLSRQTGLVRRSLREDGRGSD